MKLSKSLIAVLAASTYLPTSAHAGSCKDVVVKVSNHEHHDIKVSDVEYTISGKSDGKEWTAGRNVKGRSCEVWTRNLDRAGNEHVQLTIKYRVSNWVGWTNRSAVIGWKVCKDGDEIANDFRDGWAVPVCN